MKYIILFLKKIVLAPIAVLGGREHSERLEIEQRLESIRCL